MTILIPVYLLWYCSIVGGFAMGLALSSLIFVVRARQYADYFYRQQAILDRMSRDLVQNTKSQRL